MSIEIPNPMKEKIDPRIEEAASFEALYSGLREVGEIHGTQTRYPAEKLIEYIEKVRKGEMDLSYITRSYGLQRIVKKLLEQEQGN